MARWPVRVPQHFIAADGRRGRQLLRDQGLDASRLPVMIRYDGYTTVRRPAQLIAAVGASVRNDVGKCDAVIVGAGSAGLPAAVYAA